MIDLQNKLKTLPTSPGVYFHKSKSGEVIYVGKAAVLKNRVNSYFRKMKNRDPKTEALIAEIFDTDWIETESEIDALFLEAEMVKRYMPRFNILLRDDKSLEYVRINIKDPRPVVIFSRRPLDDGAEYFGPFINGWAVKRALKHLRRIFPYLTNESRSSNSNSFNKKSKLYEQIGLEPKLENEEDLEIYRANLRKLMQYLRGNRADIEKEFEREMKQAAKRGDYEQAALMRNKLFAMQGLKKQIIFSDREFMDLSKDWGLNQLAELLNLESIPKRIEGFDISHMSGTNNVASMVVFSSGMPDKKNYRKFKMRILGNNDFAHMHEAISRRLRPKNVKAWGLPDLFLIDGGKGQLSSAMQARNETGFDVPMIGLAKREEEIIISTGFISDEKQLGRSVQKMNGFIKQSEDYYIIELSKNSHIIKLLQRIRDESHRFAVSYHTSLKRSGQTKSVLDSIPTVGPATRKKLIKTFGSLRGVQQARDFELEKTVGTKKATLIKQYLRKVDK